LKNCFYYCGLNFYYYEKNGISSDGSVNGGWGSREWCLVGSIFAVAGAVVAGGPAAPALVASAAAWALSC